MSNASFKYRVPDGEKAPGQEVIFISPEGVPGYLENGADVDPDAGFTYWTREPLRPELPTEVGSAIVNVLTKEGVEHPVAFRMHFGAAPWVVFNGHDREWMVDDDIVSFDYARVVPTETRTDVLDEEDKSPVLDADNDLWEWDAEIDLWRDATPLYHGTKDSINRRFGPIRFARDRNKSPNGVSLGGTCAQDLGVLG